MMKIESTIQHAQLRQTMSAKVSFAFVAAMALCGVPKIARSQIFVTNNEHSNVISPSGGSIGAYRLDGSAVNFALISNGLDGPRGIAVSGTDLLAASYGYGYGADVGEYTIDGATVNQSLLHGTFLVDIATSRSNIYLTYGTRVGKYTTSGTTVSEFLVQHLNDPRGIAVSGDGTHFFVVDFGDVPDGITGSVGEYDATTGAAINGALIVGLNDPTGIALSGNNLYVANSSAGTIGKYDLDGTPVNPAFITGLSNPLDLAEFGGNLYVVNNGTNSIGEYDAATGATINSALITGLNDPQGIAIVPEPTAWTLFVAGLAVLFAFRHWVGKVKLTNGIV
jgi:streptogramin lyase